MLEFLLNADTKLFLLINGWHSPFFDILMTYISAKLFWLPLYLLLFWLIIRDFGKKTFILLLFIAAVLVLTDQVSVHLFKNVFQRLRPCHNESLAALVHTVNNHCGGKYSFVSSHATNVFGIVAFMFGLLGKRYKWLIWILLVWGLLVMYSRVYLGVHYPGDVLAGAVVGMIIGSLLLLAYRYADKKWFRSWSGADTISE
jgi:undecaprenyl-diphosphatase